MYEKYEFFMPKLLDLMGKKIWRILGAKIQIFYFCVKLKKINFFGIFVNLNFWIKNERLEHCVLIEPQKLIDF